jgi:hypothetical protein
MKSIKLLAAAAALTASSAAMAGAPWTYVDLGYVVADSIEDEENEALALRGSYGFADLFHVGGSISTGEIEGGKGAINGADTTGYGIYFGVNPAITENMDLVARVGYDYVEGDVGAPDDIEATQIYVLAGPRAMMTEKLELSAYVSLAAGEVKSDQPTEDFTNIGYQVGGEYYFTPMFSLGVDASVGEVNAANVHVRLSF